MPAEFAGDVAHSEHPDWDARKELAGKALAALHFELQAEDGGLRPVRDVVWSRSTHGASDNRYTLSAFLADLHRRAADAAEESARRSEVVHARVAAFKQAADKLDCARCTAGTPCNGRFQDDARLVAGGGLCLSVFTRMFDELLPLASKAYARITTRTAPTGAIRVRLTTEVTRKTDAGLGGKTHFPQSDALGSRTATVTITLPVATLTARHMSELPYYMFHEIFVHCAEAWGSAGRRTHTRETCAFREGFVDAAAATRLRRALLRGELSLIDIPNMNAVFAYATMSAHFARSIESNLPSVTIGGPAIEGLRRSGALTFMIFNDAFGEDAEVLACALNVLETSDDERSRMIALLERVGRCVGEHLSGPTNIRELALDLRRLLSEDVIDADAIGRLLLGACPEEEF